MSFVSGFSNSNSTKIGHPTIPWHWSNWEEGISNIEDLEITLVEISVSLFIVTLIFILTSFLKFILISASPIL